MTGRDVQPSYRVAMLYSFAQKYLAFLLQLGLAVVLARLLSPEESGIYSLAAAAVGIGNLLRDLGTTDYVISRKDVTQEKLRAAFTVTLLMAWLIALILLAVAPFLAAIYKEPGVGKVLQLLCINFLLLPFGAVTSALMSKGMRFERMFWVQTSAAVLSAAVTLWTAYSGWSYMSLAVGSVVANVWTIAMMLVLEPRSVALMPTTKGLREVLNFGGTVTVARLAEQLAGRGGEFIVTGMLGFHAAGLNSKASSLIGSFNEFFNSAVVRVATPAFAQMSGDPVAERKRYLQSTVVVATALWIFFPLLGTFAQEIVMVLFGSKWLECVALVQVSAVGSLMFAPFLLSNSLLTARGAVKEQLKIQMIAAPIWLLAVTAGAFQSLLLVVVLANAAMMVRIALLHRAVERVSGIGLSIVLRSLLPSFRLAVLAAAVGALVRWGLITIGASVYVVLLCGVSSLLLTAALFAWKARHPLFEEALRILRERAAARIVPPSAAAR
jgi:O-antigen/teichoic acid export membrane protein